MHREIVRWMSMGLFWVAGSAFAATACLELDAFSDRATISVGASAGVSGEWEVAGQLASLRGRPTVDSQGIVLTCSGEAWGCPFGETWVLTLQFAPVHLTVATADGLIVADADGLLRAGACPLDSAVSALPATIGPGLFPGDTPCPTCGDGAPQAQAGDASWITPTPFPGDMPCPTCGGGAPQAESGGTSWITPAPFPGDLPCPNCWDGAPQAESGGTSWITPAPFPGDMPCPNCWDGAPQVESGGTSWITPAPFPGDMPCPNCSPGG